MSRFSIVHAFVMSFYSKKLYRDVAANWGVKSLWYLLILLAICWFPYSISIQSNLSQRYKQESDEIVVQIPVVNIKQGKIITPEKRPYIITNPKTHEKVIIIDTTGKYTTLKDTKADVLITETQIISQVSPTQIRIDQVPGHLDIRIDPQQVNGYVKNYIGSAWIFFFIFLILASFVYRLIQALLYSLIGKIFASISKIHLSYGQIFSITLIAITPVIVIATIFELFNIAFVFQNLFYFVLAMFYLFYGIVANKR